MRKFRKFIKDKPELFKGMKSVKEYIQIFGGTNGMNIWLIEYNSLADYEKESARMQKDEGAQKLNNEWQALIDPVTVSVDVWRPTE